MNSPHDVALDQSLHPHIPDANSKEEGNGGTPSHSRPISPTNTSQMDKHTLSNIGGETLGDPPTTPSLVAPGETSDNLQTGALLSQPTQNQSTHAEQESSGKKRDVPSPIQISPTRRRSVQFARNGSVLEVPEASKSRASSIFSGEDEGPAKDNRGSSFLSKLKAFAASPSFPTHSRSPSGFTTGAESVDARSGVDNITPLSENERFRFPRTLQDAGSDADADVESSSGEQESGRPKKQKRKTKRPPDQISRTAPPTPKSFQRPSLATSNTFNMLEDYRSNHATSRSIATSLPFIGREGVSEDEGRDRLNKDNVWRRRGWLQNTRGPSYGGNGRSDARNSHEERRPSNLRRFTGFGSPENAEGSGPVWRRHKGERGSSLSAQKWRQIKAGLKMIGQRKKIENTVDHVKSAELMAELTSGVPAALLLASMFQRDEHGSKRIPILLEQLKVHVTDSEFDSHSGDRHLVFRIELEYGSGITRMKWVIHRTLRDFANLHLKYKLQIGTQKYIQLRSHDSGNQLPHFPRGAFPYMRGVRGLESDEEDDEDIGDETGAEATSGNERTGKKKKKRRASGGVSRRQSSVTSPQEGSATASGLLMQGDAPPESVMGATKRETYPERQRKKLETYLQKMIRFLIFRPDSNRLCKFLELSALGVRLAAEGSYHGKEGFLVIQSSKGLDFRRALNPAMMKSRHSPKWFLVRHSYVVCVDSPEEMHIYDVFLVDPFFQIQAQKMRLRDQKPKELAKSAKESAKHPQHHTLKLQNSERKLRLLARNERQLHQFEDSIRFMVENTPWAKPNRFDSFAPVRPNCFAQWLVDGRDHMWVVSRAINQAKDVIYIHDWWLSPEIYMRRPAAISQKWRLDRLLQKKAQEGVKVFVIMYRNINSAIPIDSEYSKFSLLDLHPNVFVQRSPNQFRQNTFFWAHHEKLCIVDHTLAFVGGIDLCFGRWDTPQHVVTDDKLTGFENTDSPKDSDHCQLWPGKDYSNPRVQDFFDLDKPYEEMYNREVIPRMPWHDISMHVVGQPARDLTRHFVQRWNYILRQRKPTRPTPFLLPPPDFNPADLESLGLDGTCEVQILRSSSTWSTGTPDVTEHSIMNAYVKLIEASEHFVYIENQFFVSSCEVEGKKIENHIGDALVERIIRAADNDEDWRAVILVPLMPGFQNAVDTEGGTSVRLIMQCQYRSICRGETSIFGRLRAHGVEPEDYIQFFSLRSWGKIGPRQQFVTEQCYIHAKCMIVDDRVSIIGSANINERSMLGSRDSEVAAVVRDTDLLWSTMNGKPYLVGRFPHTLRMRLMREHIGIDVDAVLEDERQEEAEQAASEDKNGKKPAHHQDPKPVEIKDQAEKEALERKHKLQDEFLSRSEDMHSFNHDVDWEQADNPNLKSNRKLTADSRVTRNPDHRKDIDGLGVDQMKARQDAGYGKCRDTHLSQSNVELLTVNEGTVQKKPASRGSEASSPSFVPGPQPGEPPSTGDSSLVTPTGPIVTTQDHSHNDGIDENVNLLSPEAAPGGSHPLVSELRRPIVDKDCMKDPISDSFYLDTWQTVAENNTKLFRSVFRCMPDNEVKTWKDYKEYTTYAERFADMQNSSYYRSNASNVQGRSGTQNQAASGPPGTGATYPIAKMGVELEKASEEAKEKLAQVAFKDKAADENVRHWAIEANKAQLERQHHEVLNDEPSASPDEKSSPKPSDKESSPTSQDADHQPATLESEKFPEGQRSNARHTSPGASNLNSSQSQRRRRRATTRSSKREFQASDDIIGPDDAEELLNMVQGHLIIWPYEW